MNLYELVDALGGEIVRSVARVRIEGKYVVLGKISNGMQDMTPEGRRLADTFAPPAEPIQEAPSRIAPARGKSKKPAEPAPPQLDDFEV